MRKTTRIISIGSLVVACFFLTTDLSPAQKSTKVKFLLDWAFQGQQAAFTVPVDDGTFQRLGLDVTVDRGVGSGDTVVKVASGAYDIGFADFNAMIRFNDQNPNQKLIAVMIAHDKGTTGLATKNNGKIKSPKDLTGKTLASPQGDASRQLFPLFAKINGLDENSIKWINIAPELRETMLIRDEADAISGDVPTVMLNIRALKMSETDIKVMPYSEFGLQVYGKAIVVKPDYAEKNPEVVKNFIRGAVHGMNVLIKDPDAAFASVRKRDALLQPEIEKARIKMTLEYAVITPNVLKNGYSNIDLSRLDQSLRDIAQGVQLKTVPTSADVYTDRYLPPREELKMAQ